MSDSVIVPVAATRLIPVWDIWLRLFHWLLVLDIICLYITGKLGGNWLEWHQRAGYLALGLIGFRLIWGMVGSHHARFIHFVKGPITVWRYLRGRLASESAQLGHNPLGAWSVVAMLLVVAVQAVTGLFSNDDVLLEGPYAAKVSKELSDWLTGIHKINSNILLALIALHVLAIVLYAVVKKNNLVGPMLTGRKLGTGAAPDISRPRWLAPLVILGVGVITWLLVGRH
ncbi:MAG: cytochrome b/b6 domain-containing protein [Betaproteobacteria bacterium]|nr:cytochrome b/b6 domain-containing protein [Betaproteobacteria bacterium]